ncbi:hypothetical protein BDV32DRAFT_154323 [Aspergillus pseudonomiae]|uniref:Uncharacterized protein n=1 Tax=Aspergillus pseudonomiae TaxID=1506151 RepID=A0A5N6HNE3_9EURO|nr:uncharacterized protein BDV37DRAFT_290803 [Aspergillus pseudonomiae]KAB8255374.1 hypothetical protein BDV32DRAFT_154323 [Aspergillus pseudonomiae]KAE8398828.1 hypothetical protein BDV37DRAFT_290803 [Aspergillus pseudonomiae]
MDLQPVWFITGCSSGVGKALVQTAVQAGHHVVATARNVASLSYLPDGPRVLKLGLDVTSKSDITQSLSTAVEKFGRIDILVNNAGYAVMGDTETVPESDARLQMETLFWGPVFLTQEAVRIFREVNPSGQGGTVVQVSSIGGLVTFPGSAFYHASKFALGSFTESFAKEMDPAWNIKFMVVAPGGIKTDFGSNIQFAARHPAYDTPTSPFNQLLAYMSNPAVQEMFSTPEQLARVLLDVVTGQAQRPLPRRLLMGAETIALLEADLKTSAEDLESWKDETLRCSSQTSQ